MGETRRRERERETRRERGVRKRFEGTNKAIERTEKKKAKGKKNYGCRHIQASPPF
jgi:hypothetical protein